MAGVGSCSPSISHGQKTALTAANDRRVEKTWRTPRSADELEATSLTHYAEGAFVYRGPPISRAMVDFDDAQADFFAIDNLTFDGVPSALFVRGDTDGSGKVTISDAVEILACFFRAEVDLACESYSACP